MENEITLDDSERQPCEVWTRVMGYFRPTFTFNRGKKGEFAERVYFSEARAAAYEYPKHTNREPIACQHH